MNLNFTCLSKYITDPSWWQGIGTVAAVIAVVAFYFLDRLRTWKNRPILDININFRPPDCHHIPTTVRDINNSVQQFDAFWFRLTVRNRGRSAAQNLEVLIHDLEKQVDNSWRLLSEFLLSNLVWTHIAQQYLPMLLPGTEKNVDLGHVIDPKARGVVPTENNSEITVVETQAVFYFETTILPNNRYNIIGPGEYKFTITVGASNCAPKSKSFKLKISGEWHLDESTMLSRGVRIERI